MRVIVATLLLMLPGLGPAHHSRAAFDLEGEIAVEGAVTTVGWTNPHYYLEVKDGQGTAWTFEGHSIPGLVRNGWRRDSIAVGERVRVVARRNRDPAIAFALLEHVTRQDGKTFYSFRPTEELARQPKPPLQPSADFSGTWRLIRSLTANLVSGFEPPADWPLTAQAREEVDRFDIDDDPALRCESLGIPRMLAWPYSQKWRLLDEGMHVTIEHAVQQRMFRFGPAENAGADPHMGESLITSRGDGTLTVTSTGFPDKHWGLARGISSSTDKRLVEQYTLAEDGLRLDLTVRISDRAALSAPVEMHYSYAKVHDFEFAEEPPCDVATATRHLQYE